MNDFIKQVHTGKATTPRPCETVVSGPLHVQGPFTIFESDTEATVDLGLGLRLLTRRCNQKQVDLEEKLKETEDVAVAVIHTNHEDTHNTCRPLTRVPSNRHSYTSYSKAGLQEEV